MESFSIYSNTYDTYSWGELSVKDIYEVISLKKRLSMCKIETWPHIDMWPFKVQRFRETKNKFIKERELPAVIFYASTERYDRKRIKVPSGYFGIDLDFADNKVLFENNSMDIVKKMVTDKLGSACLLFVSPSGHGLKVIHKINPVGHNLEDHVYVSHKVFEHFQREYSYMGLIIDNKCKDWNRLCYLSYDREALYNKDSISETIAIPETIISPLPVLDKDVNGYQLSSDRRDKDQICPRCSGGRHHDKSFTYYVDQNGTRLDGCGVCSRAKCSANIKPWENYPIVKWIYLGKIRS
jgi:hypothetical protein